VGLNPVLLELAVGGAHNDTLVLALLAAALALTAGSAPRYRAGAWALVTAVGVKVTAGVVLPFLVLGSAPQDPSAPLDPPVPPSPPTPPSSPASAAGTRVPTRARARAQLRVASWAALGLSLLAALGLIGFGAHAFGFVGAVGEQQQLVADHSVPAETARLLGLHGTPGWWRHCFLAGFAAVGALALWRTARGADWRTAAGWTMLALLVATAWLVPWYAIWLLPLAAVSGDRRLRAAALVLCAYAVLIHLSLADPLLGAAHHPGPHAHVALLGR
jgi:alpha-1,6-mannosyltransferase